MSMNDFRMMRLLMNQNPQSLIGVRYSITTREPEMKLSLWNQFAGDGGKE